MHRTHQAGLLAIALVLAASWHWWAAVPVAYLLWRTHALTGWLAALIGLAVLRPAAWWVWMLALPLLLWLRYRQPPGAMLDTIRARLLSWIYLVQDVTWLGRGPGSARLTLEAAHIRSDGRALDGDPARNEWLEVVYEYGLLAVIPLAVLAAWATMHVHLGDPATASLAAATVVLGVTSPLRACWRWLRGDRATLFGPPLRISLSVHVDARGEVMIYGAQTMGQDRETQLEVARALVLAMNAWHEAYDIQPEEMLNGLR